MHISSRSADIHRCKPWSRSSAHRLDLWCQVSYQFRTPNGEEDTKVKLSLIYTNSLVCKGKTNYRNIDSTQLYTETSSQTLVLYSEIQVAISSALCIKFNHATSDQRQPRKQHFQSHFKYHTSNLPCCIVRLELTGDHNDHSFGNFSLSSLCTIYAQV